MNNDGEDISPDDYGETFSLPNGEKAPFQQMAFTLADAQADFIKSCIEQVKGNVLETDKFGNQNKNGNALYKIVKEWAEQKK